MQALEGGWLNYDGDGVSASSSYIGGVDHPTIADILAYGELSAVTMTNLLQLPPNDYPSLNTWLSQMSKLPCHDQVHQALTTLGDLSSTESNEEELPFGKRLGAATKAGLKAIAEAQQTYSSSKL